MTLFEIRDFLGLGLVHKQHLKRYRGENCQDGYRLYIIGLKICLKIANILKKSCWYSRKKKDFYKWCGVLKIMRNKGHLTIKGILKIASIRDTMNLRIKRQKGYHNLDKIRKLVTNRKLKYCNWCGKEIPVDKGSQNCCNNECKRKYYNKKITERWHRIKNHKPDNFKLCIICGNKFYRKDFKNGFENMIVCANARCKKKRHKDIIILNKNMKKSRI